MIFRQVEVFMGEKEYFWKTKKHPIKTKPRNKSLPKAKEKYLEAEEDFEEALDLLGIKFEKKFQFKSTKYWRFDFHLIEHRIQVEISGGPWSGGRKGKLATKAWSVDKYDHAEDMGFRFHRFEIGEINMGHATKWLRNLKANYETVQTIPTDGSD